MGKRKSRKAPPKKMMQKVATVFDCPFCNHEKSVECKLDRKTSVGAVRCRVCAADYQMRITSLMEPVDVYGDWIDECDKVNVQDDNQGTVGNEDDEEDEAPVRQRQQKHTQRDDDDDDEAFSSYSARAQQQTERYDDDDEDEEDDD
ncbi:transcription elongation factor 1 [Acrasis kona]|uniref:Transcription elongation factor 1 homolog n=1 Tax=Acrasis kona TaxID=1008807 RepID=A0AAW2ZAV7_9EUKA